MTQDCDDRAVAAAELELFFGDASDAVARVYARLPRNETTIGLQLTGELIGPECRFAQTLSARIPFQDRGPGESLLAEAVVPDPCFWTPELPMLYRAKLGARGEGRGASQAAEIGGQRLASLERKPGKDGLEIVISGRTPEHDALASIEKWLGIRRLGTKGPSLILDTERWVPRGLWLERIRGKDSQAAREANIALGGPAPDDDICLEASRHGVPLLVELLAPIENLANEMRRLAQWPAVFFVVLDRNAPVDSTVRSAGKNLVFAAKFAADEPILSPPPWAQVLLCDVTSENRIRIGESMLPILALRQAPATFSTARSACDRLQYDLASVGDFAGYLV